MYIFAFSLYKFQNHFAAYIGRRVFRVLVRALSTGNDTLFLQELQNFVDGVDNLVETSQSTEIDDKREETTFTKPLVSSR